MKLGQEVWIHGYIDEMRKDIAIIKNEGGYFGAVYDEIVTDVQPKAKAGKWIHRNDDFNDWLECSNCGYGSEGEVKYGEGTPYCPMCGCQMMEEKI